MQGQVALVQRVCDAIAGEEADAILTLGPAVSAGAIRVPGNVEAVPYADHDRLLPRCAAIVTHGGLGTTLRALAHGKPLLLLPLGRDQQFNARRVVELGASIRLPVDASPAENRLGPRRASHSAAVHRTCAERRRNDRGRRRRRNGHRGTTQPRPPRHVTNARPHVGAAARHDPRGALADCAPSCGGRRPDATCCSTYATNVALRFAGDTVMALRLAEAQLVRDRDRGHADRRRLVTRLVANSRPGRRSASRSRFAVVRTVVAARCRNGSAREHGCH
jgi:hypothetical protein